MVESNAKSNQPNAQQIKEDYAATQVVLQDFQKRVDQMVEMAKSGEVLTFPLDTNAAINNAQLMNSAKEAQEKGRQRRVTKAKKQQDEVHDVHMEEHKEEPCNKNDKGKQSMPM